MGTLSIARTGRIIAQASDEIRIQLGLLAAAGTAVLFPGLALDDGLEGATRNNADRVSMTPVARA